MSDSKDAPLPLSCIASSKPRSHLSWTADPATPALVVNQSIVTKCKTAADGIVTCERNATVVTKEVTMSSVNVTCQVHFEDQKTVVISSRACVTLVLRPTAGTFMYSVVSIP